jgi:hypothetical protein
MLTSPQFVFAKPGGQGIITDRPPVSTVGLLAANEFEPESLTGALQRVEILN